MNISKAKIMTTDDYIVMRLGAQVIEEVVYCMYLGHVIKLGKENQTTEINKRVRQTGACILPVMTYGIRLVTILPELLADLKNFG